MKMILSISVDYLMLLLLFFVVPRFVFIFLILLLLFSKQFVYLYVKIFGATCAYICYFLLLLFGTEFFVGMDEV